MSAQLPIVLAYVDCLGLQAGKPVFFNLEITTRASYGPSTAVDNTAVTRFIAGGILRTGSASRAIYGEKRSYSASNITPIDQYATIVGRQENIERREQERDEKRKSLGKDIETVADVGLCFVPVGKGIKLAATILVHMAIAEFFGNNALESAAEVSRDECIDWLWKRFFTMVGLPEAELLIKLSASGTSQAISTAQTAAEAKMHRPLTPAERRMQQVHAFWSFADPAGYEKHFSPLSRPSEEVRPIGEG